MNTNDLQALAAAAQIVAAIGTLAIALLTLAYVKATRAMVTEMKAARDRAEQPRLVVYPDVLAGGSLAVTVENVGRSAAEEVSVTFPERDLRGVVTTLQWPALPDRVILRGAYLAAGQKVRRMCTPAEVVSSMVAGNYGPVPVDLRWAWPPEKRSFSETAVVDVSQLNLLWVDSSGQLIKPPP